MAATCPQPQAQQLPHLQHQHFSRPLQHHSIERQQVGVLAGLESHRAPYCSRVSRLSAHDARSKVALLTSFQAGISRIVKWTFWR